MLQKLENAYLAILRILVIAIAGGLLIAVVIFGLNSLRTLQSEPQEATIQPTVSPQKLIDAVTDQHTKSEPMAESNGSATYQKNEPDFNAKYYWRSVYAIVGFIKKDKNMSIDNAHVFEIVKEHAESFKDVRLTAIYAKGLAETLEKTFESKAVIMATKESSTMDVANKALDSYRQNFIEQLELEKEKFAAKQRSYFENKAKGMQNLYIAGAALAAFLFIVFLSVITKIERNLRYLERIERNPRYLENKPVITS